MGRSRTSPGRAGGGCVGSVRSRVAVALTVAALIPATFTACNDDDGDPPAATATAPAAQSTPEDPAIIDGQTFISVASSYRIEFPEGWTPDDNFIYAPTTVTDVFFAPVGNTPVQANVQVRCDRDLGDFTAEEYIAARRQVADGFAITEVTESAATVAGQAAVRLSYQQRPGGETVVDKTDVIFFSNGCGWTLTLTDDTTEDRSSEFDTMLTTFAFTG